MGGSHRFGEAAERLVAAHLRARGYRILATNWRFHSREIDIIARRDATVAFVEVKARSAGGWGHPLEAITAAKRRDLTLAARAWLASEGRRDSACRFDAAVVVRSRDGLALDYYEDAWRP